ncbi:hypothetical protein JDV02_006436 [Purpureocillium takamizusanense]|uniref:Uncharacterized protein n=1 Tax=Purpureocillium takamizusanense TaxID=2060973 RepID=A0A9Q8QK92_9HYPO|nr:uncharacterized protein JDV02_006436 [Purpureocillium takamizusanense]UNI20339.1 hypothetical protein JDV02_006436 [Purpureocillium takamizusanense]
MLPLQRSLPKAHARRGDGRTPPFPMRAPSSLARETVYQAGWLGMEKCVAANKTKRGVIQAGNMVDQPPAMHTMSVQRRPSVDPQSVIGSRARLVGGGRATRRRRVAVNRRVRLAGSGPARGFQPSARAPPASRPVFQAWQSSLFEP